MGKLRHKKETASTQQVSDRGNAPLGPSASWLAFPLGSWFTKPDCGGLATSMQTSPELGSVSYIATDVRHKYSGVFPLWLKSELNGLLNKTHALQESKSPLKSIAGGRWKILLTSRKKATSWDGGGWSLLLATAQWGSAGQVVTPTTSFRAPQAWTPLLPATTSHGSHRGLPLPACFPYCRSEV